MVADFTIRKANSVVYAEAKVKPKLVVYCDSNIFLNSPEFMQRTKAWLARDGEVHIRKRLADIGVPAVGIKQILREARR